jgi:hypothetical protein
MKIGDYEVEVQARVIDGPDRVELVLVGEYTALGLVVLGFSEVAVAAGRAATRGDDTSEVVATLANEMLVALSDAFEPPPGRH